MISNLLKIFYQKKSKKKLDFDELEKVSKDGNIIEREVLDYIENINKSNEN